MCNLSRYIRQILKKHKVFNGKWLTRLPLPSHKPNTKIITKGAHAHALLKQKLRLKYKGNLTSRS